MLTTLKAFLRKALPTPVLVRYRRFRRLREHKSNRGKTMEQVFAEMYRKNRREDSGDDYCSGSGTANEEIVAAYVAMISDRADSENFRGLTFVDLGCGDFRVGIRLLPLCSRYTGVDVVSSLVRRNKERYGNASTDFLHLDIVADDLPTGDVCFLRQVLQHLSNGQITTVLHKLRKYRWAFITEHYPTDNDEIRPNVDKPCGRDIRAYDNSGVYLTAPPFSLPAQQVEKVLEVPGVGLGEGRDPGVIRTFLYRPQAD